MVPNGLRLSERGPEHAVHRYRRSLARNRQRSDQARDSGRTSRVCVDIALRPFRSRLACVIHLDLHGRKIRDRRFRRPADLFPGRLRPGPPPVRRSGRAELLYGRGVKQRGSAVPLGAQGKRPSLGQGLMDQGRPGIPRGRGHHHRSFRRDRLRRTWDAVADIL